MNILLTNDDGIDSPGLLALARGLAEAGSVWVVAPTGNRSGVSRSITVRRPLIVHAHPVEGAAGAWAVDGMPADCVKLACAQLVEGEIDFAFSGPNRGLNVGVHAQYSGTVAGAAEAAAFGIASAAISVARDAAEDLRRVVAVALKLIERPSAGWPAGCFLNVNIPSTERGPLQGIRVVPHGRVGFRERFVERESPAGRTYYWAAGPGEGDTPTPGTDVDAVRRGFVAVTPLHNDLTHRDAMDEVGGWDLDGFLGDESGG